MPLIQPWDVQHPLDAACEDLIRPGQPLGDRERGPPLAATVGGAALTVVQLDAPGTGRITRGWVTTSQDGPTGWD